VENANWAAQRGSQRPARPTLTQLPPDLQSLSTGGRRDAAASGIFSGVADRKDDPGVLGNLPRSRPGTRSSKRATGGSAKRQPAAGATGRRASTAARKSATASKTAGPRATKARTTTPPPRRQPAQQTDPVTQAVRLAGKVAETGVKTTVGVLRRLTGGR
jgi:hypothetical protein